MGALGFTEFCKNGHIVKEVPHHYIDISEDIIECPYCKTNEFTTVCEWPDPDYGADIIPIEPVKYEWIEFDNDWFKGKQKIAIYDVSKITDWKKR